MENNLVVLNIFGKEYKVSRQARMVFFAYLVNFITVVIMALLGGRAMMMSSILMIVVTSVLVVLSTYATNCMVVGQCNIYAWVIVGLSIAIAVIHSITILYVLYVKFSMMKSKNGPTPRRSSSKRK